MSGYVAAWMGQAVDQMHSDWIGHHDEDNRYRFGRLLCCQCALGGDGHQQVHFESNELFGKSLVTLKAFSGIPILKREPPLWPTQLLEFLAEWNEEDGLLFLTTSVPKN